MRCWCAGKNEEKQGDAVLSQLLVRVHILLGIIIHALLALLLRGLQLLVRTLVSVGVKSLNTCHVK